MKATLILILVLSLAASPLWAGCCDEGRSPLVKSLLWPGLGQADQERYAVAAVWAGSAALASAAVFFTSMEYHSSAQDYENAMASYDQALATGDMDTAWEQFAAMEDFHPLAEDRLATRNQVRLLLAGLWAANLVDVWLSQRRCCPSADEKSGKVSLRLEPVFHADRGGLMLSLKF